MRDVFVVMTGYSCEGEALDGAFVEFDAALAFADKITRGDDVSVYRCNPEPCETWQRNGGKAQAGVPLRYRHSRGSEFIGFVDREAL